MYRPTMCLTIVFAWAGAACAGQPEVTGERTLRWDGRSFHTIDDEGVFVIDLDGDGPGVPLPEASRTARGIIEQRGGQTPVRCRLTDYVDCTQKTHEFHERSERGEGDPSAVHTILGKPFRVTGMPQKDSKGNPDRWPPPYFAYNVQTADKAGVPHLIVYEMPNDRERYTTVSITVPEGIGKGDPWSPPYTGQEKKKVDALKMTQEPFWYEPDVGLCVYTGRDLPITNEIYLSHFVFYPKTKRMNVRISSSSLMHDLDERAGAAVSRIWVFEILDPLAERLPDIKPPKAGPERRMGVYTTHPWYFSAHYGVPPFTKAQRRKSYENLCDLMAFCGLNMIQFNAINGSDRAGRTWYPSPTGHYSQLGANLLEELPPVAGPRGIDVVPVVTSITAPGPIEGDKPNKHGFTEMSFQKHYNPKVDPRAFENRPPDPLRPETQQWLIRHMVEIARQSMSHENVTGIGFRVNGKIGTCYISGEDHSGQGDQRVYSAAQMGYSQWNLAEFERESGMDVPDDSMEAYKWLRDDSGRWDRWLDFRCRRTHAFWLEVRDQIRRFRPDWALYVLTDLPAEVPATNIEWPGHGHPEGEQITLDLLRAHGYDPRMFKNDEGIIIQRVMMVDQDRIFSTRWGPPWGANPIRYRDFHEQGFLPDWYRTPAGSATEVYHAYWEEPFHPDIWEFGPDGRGYGMRTATATAVGRAFHRAATFTLRAGNTDTIVMNGWERPVLGHEHDLRRFCQAFRALPVETPEPLGTVPAGEKIFAGQYGDHIGVINDSPETVTLRVSLRDKLPKGRQLVDVATGHVLIDKNAGNRETFTIDLLDYDVRTLIVE